MSDGHYWTYSEWVHHTVEKISKLGANLSKEDREIWLSVQVKLAIEQARRHGRSGRSDDDPVAP